jgi:pilus assembly protein CpaE
MTESAENVIRVLIVDDFAETRENIRKLLQFESDVLVVGAARTGIEAIDLAKET